MIPLKPVHQPRPGPVPLRTQLLAVPSGGIYLEVGADGVYLQFDADCRDVLAHCKARCCALGGLDVMNGEELERLRQLKPPPPMHVGEDGLVWQLSRRADGYCRCNDPVTRACMIYTDR